MKFTKRIISLLLTVIMIVSMVPAMTLPSSAATVVKSGSCGTNVSYVLDSDGRLTISGAGAMADYSLITGAPWYSNRGSVKTVVIGSGVTSIGNYAFYDCSSLTSVTIGSGVTSIGYEAFRGCISLTSVTIPSSVKSIGGYAFRYCTSLTSVHISDIGAWCGVEFDGYYSNPLCHAHNLYLNGKLVTDLVIPDSVTSIGGSAFQDCSGLTSVTIPDSVTSIGGYAFSGCSSLTSVTIPNSVTSIGDYTFRGCTSLTSVTIPSSVTSIVDSAFRDCTSLTSVMIPGSVTSIGESAFRECRELTGVVIPGSVQTIGKSAFYGCTKLASAIIVDGVESIGRSAFNQSGLTSVTIPASVTSMDENAFYACTKLTDIYCEASSRPSGWSADWTSNCSATVHWGHVAPPAVVASGSCGSSVFWALDSAGTLTISGSGTMANYSSSNGAPWDYWCLSIKAVAVVSGVASIGNCAFYDCSSLTSVTIPNSVTSIGSYAFSGCSGLTSVTIPSSVTSIVDYAFYDCTSLTSVTIPNSVTSIRSYAFSGCSGLTSVTIPNSVTSIGWQAFSSCSSLTSVTIPDSVTSIGSSAFSGCSSLTSVVIPDSVTSIGDSAFRGCTSLTSVTIPGGVTSIGSYAFSGCSGLTSVTIGSGVTTVGGSAFSGCASLESVTISSGVKNINNYAYAYCSSLTSVTIPGSVQKIGQSAFLGCTKLASVTIENGVESIGRSAFNQCGLTSVAIPASVTSVDSNAFYKCTGLTDIYCEAPSQPSGWNVDWKNDCSATVHWGYVIPATLTASWVVEGETVYTATFIEGEEEPTYAGETPVKTEDENYTYTFSEWSRSVDEDGNVTYTAVFAATAKTVILTASWVVEGETVYTATFTEGEEEPTYAGETPIKVEDENYTYTFSEWSRSVDEDGNVTYTAIFAATAKPVILTATWVVEGESVYTTTFTEGDEEPTYAGETPVKTEDENYTYTFSEWSRSVDADGNVTYTAIFAAIPVAPDAILTVQNATASICGSSVVVSILLDAAETIQGYEFAVDYDTDVLTFVSASHFADHVGAKYGYTNVTGNSGYPLVIGCSLDSGTHLKGSMTLVELTFAIAEDAEAGEYEITLVPVGGVEPLYDNDGGVEYSRRTELVAGTVTLQEFLLGDANSDGVLSIRDISEILSALSGVSEINSTVMDVNKDGMVSIRDVSQLLNILAMQ